MLKEWPLVAFTIVGQTAFGLFLIAGAPLFFFRDPALGAPARGSRLPVVLTALGLMAAASFLSFFHLQHPWRAFRVLTNIKTSWLSREIFFELGFMALLAVLAFLLWKGVGQEGLHRSLFAAAGLCGVLFILSMSRVYMMKAVPVWDHAYTPASFFLTAFMLGSLAAAAFFGSWPEQPPLLRSLLICCLALVAAGFLAALFLAPEHGVFGIKAAASLSPPGSATAALHFARLALLCGGVIVLTACLFKTPSAAGSKSVAVFAVAVALLLVLAAEVLGRFHFYGLVGRSGP